jgi:hypothetical protein
MVNHCKADRWHECVQGAWAAWLVCSAYHAARQQSHTVGLFDVAGIAVERFNQLGCKLCVSVAGGVEQGNEISAVSAILMTPGPLLVVPRLHSLTKALQQLLLDTAFTTTTLE